MGSDNETESSPQDSIESGVPPTEKTDAAAVDLPAVPEQIEPENNEPEAPEGDIKNGESNDESDDAAAVDLLAAPDTDEQMDEQGNNEPEAPEGDIENGKPNEDTASDDAVDTSSEVSDHKEQQPTEQGLRSVPKKNAVVTLAGGKRKLWLVLAASIVILLIVIPTAIVMSSTGGDDASKGLNFVTPEDQSNEPANDSEATIDSTSPQDPPQDQNEVPTTDVADQPTNAKPTTDNEDADAGESITAPEELVPDLPDAEPVDPYVPQNPPANDMCADAISITWPSDAARSMMVFGTTIDSQFEDLGYSRHDVNQKFGFGRAYLDELGSVCDWRFSTGVWYKIAGRGRGIRVTTCDGSDVSDSKPSLSVYRGSSCEALGCVVNHATSCGSPGSVERNTLSWNGLQGFTYHVFVETAVAGQGEFNLHIEEFDTPVNDVCLGAIPIMELKKPVEASVAGATAEFAGKTENDSNGNLLPGVFYSVVGTGNLMKVSADCDEYGSSRIYVYERNCNNKRLIGERAICEPNSVAYFESVQGQVYHILFQSDSDVPKQLVVTEEKPAFNDMCLGAVGPIKLYDQITGNTDDARQSLEFWVDSLYYTVIGTGGVMRVVTPCDEQTMMRGARLNVFGGDCVQRTDVLDKKARHSCGTDMPYTDNMVSWQSVAGELYHVQVMSNVGTGPFIMSVEDVVEEEEEKEEYEQ